MFADMLKTQQLIQSQEKLNNRAFDVFDDKAGVYTVAMSNTCENFYAITGGSDGQLRKWDLRKLADFKLSVPEQGIDSVVVGGHNGRINDAKMNHDGNLMVTGGDDGKVKVWNLAQNAPLKTFPDDAGQPTASTEETGSTPDVPDQPGDTSEQGQSNPPPSIGGLDSLRNTANQSARPASQPTKLAAISSVSFSPCEDAVIAAPRSTNLVAYSFDNPVREGAPCELEQGEPNRVYTPLRDDIFKEKLEAYEGMPLFISDITSYKGFNSKLPTQADRNSLANSVLVSTNFGDLLWLDMREGQVLTQWLGYTRGTYNLSGGLGYSQVTSSTMMEPIGQWIMAGRADGTMVSMYNHTIDRRDQTAADSYCVAKNKDGKVVWLDSELGKLRVFRYVGHSMPVTAIRPIYFLTNADGRRRPSQDIEQKTDGLISVGIDGKLIVWQLLDDCARTNLANLAAALNGQTGPERYVETKRELVMRYTKPAENNQRKEVPLLSADVSVDSDWAVTGAADGTVHLWWIGDSMNID